MAAAQKQKQQTRRSAADSRRADLARIHIALKWATTDCGMTDGDYRALVAEVADEVGDVLPAGKEPSSGDLSAEGRRALVRAFAALGWPDAHPSDQKPARKAPPRVVGQTNGRYRSSGKRGRVSQKQLDYIAHLEDTLGWTDDVSRLVGFIARHLKAKRLPQSMSRAEASEVITGLLYVTGERSHTRGRIAGPVKTKGGQR